jgi:hypothetical protein
MEHHAEGTGKRDRDGATSIDLEASPVARVLFELKGVQ